MMSDYWIVVTVHPEDRMTGQFDKCYTSFRNSIVQHASLLPPPTPQHKLQTLHPNATLHYKQFSKPQINKTQNLATSYSSFPHWHTQIIQGYAIARKVFRRPVATKSRVQSQTIGCGICAEQSGKEVCAK